MKRSSLYWYLGSLLVCLLLAYLTWTQPRKAEQRVTVLRCDLGSLRQLTVGTDERMVTFTPRAGSHGGDPYWWVEIRWDRKVGEEDATEEAAEGFEVFKGNPKLEEALGEFCPWMALRQLAKPEGEKREELGLDDTEERLILDFAAGPRTFKIGDTAFGHQDRYVEDAETGKVFLVEGKQIREMLYPKSRFMERSLHAFEKEGVARIQLRRAGREMELIHLVSDRGRDDGWAGAQKPENPEELYQNWVHKLFALRPTEYVIPEQGEALTSGAKPILDLSLYGDREEIGFLKMYSREDPEGNSAYYGLTENTEALVLLSKTQVESLLKDVEDLLSKQTTI